MTAHLNLTKKLKNVTVVEGFPGFGLVGTISTEYLIDHLNCEQIGYAYFDSLPAILAVHGKKKIDPISIFYNKKFNLVIIHSISAVQGVEWKAADLVLDICKQLQAKNLISIEGIGATVKTGEDILYYATNPAVRTKLEKMKAKPLDEGIIIGVTSALMVKAKSNYVALFSEVKSNLPDSKSAARVLTALDSILEIKIDIKPLLKQAEKFEDKLQGIMQQAKKAQKQVDKKQISYVG